METQISKGSSAATRQTQHANSMPADGAHQREATKAERSAIRNERRAAAAAQMARGVPPDSLLPIEPNVAVLTGDSKATVYRRAKSDPTFPKLIRLSSRCTRIRAGDLIAWIAAQAKE